MTNPNNDYWEEKDEDEDEDEDKNKDVNYWDDKNLYDDDDDDDDDEKKSLILCVTVEDMPNATGSEKDKCTSCGKEVWIKSETRIEAEEPGLPIEICCNKCFVDGKIDMSKIESTEKLQSQILKILDKVSKDLRRAWK